MKILHVVNVSFVIPYYLGDQIKFFKKNGNEIYIVSSYNNDLLYLANKYDFRLKVIDITRDINILSDIRSLYILYNFIKQEKFNVVVGHTPKASILAMISAYLNFIPNRIYIRHGIMYETTIGFKRYILKTIEKYTSFFSTKTLCVSKSVLDFSLKNNLSSEQKTILINNGTCNGIDSQDKFNPNLFDDLKLNEIRNSLNIKDNDFVVGFVGRIVKDKGITELVSAWELLCQKYDNIKLLLIGPLEKRDSVNNRILDKIYNDNTIIYIGLIENTNIYYKLMNLFILPSYREGFPTVVLEASAMEIPVITTKATGCIDSIIDNTTGIFCENTITSIFNSIEKFILDTTLCKTYGKNGRKFVQENFDQQIVWESLLDIYCNEN